MSEGTTAPRLQDDEGFHRLHPLTPLLRGWKVFAAAAALGAQQAYGSLGPGPVLIAVAASIPIGAAYGYLSWRATRYRVGDGDLRLDTGVFRKQSRRVRLDRLQAVDVVRPLVGRFLGLAELRLEVAGGAKSEAPLAYLSEPAAQQLRAELLARAAGLHHETPEAPEAVLLEVPLGRLVEATARSVPVIGATLMLVAVLTMAVALRSWQVLGISVPFFFGYVPLVTRLIVTHFGFTVAASPDGLRLRHGLLETRAQTVPPGRVQAVRIIEPLLWRRRGWVRVEVDIAGYVGQAQESASLLCPVAPRAEALQVLARVLPGLDLDTVTMESAPRQARWLDPLGWRVLGVGADERVLVTRSGRFTRITDVVLHEKVQSVRLTQGPVQRRLGLASVHLDTTPGPVTAAVVHRPAMAARALVDAEVARARTARAAAAPDRWMASFVPARPTAEGLYLADPDFLADPYPTLARLRAQGPVLWHEPTGQWLAFTYAAANSVLRDRRLGRIWQDKQPTDPGAAPDALEVVNRLHRNQMMENEPPEHTRLRSLVAKAFARGHVERLRPQVQARADALLDAVRDTGSTSFDLIADLAEPLPVAVIADLLGIPESDHHLLRPWSADFVAMYEYGRGPEVDRRAVAAATEFEAYLRELAAGRQADPRNDLLSDLAAAEDGGTRLSPDELIASAILLLNAGHEASVNAFGNGVVALLADPDALATVRSRLGDAEVVVSTVEEMLRFDSPLHLFERTATTDVQIGDVLVPAGAKVAALLGAANRDPAAFPDPDTFDPTRKPNAHIGFGAGLHHCLGAPLARMELQIMVPTLLRRCPDLVLAGQPVRRPTFVLRGYASVPVSG